MVYQLRDNYYIHTAYANASDGTVDFSVSDSEERAFVGHVSNSTASEITDPSAYEWVAIDEDTEQEDETSDGIDTLIDLLDTEGGSTGNAAGGAQDTADSTLARIYGRSIDIEAQFPNNDGRVFLQTEDEDEGTEYERTSISIGEASSIHGTASAWFDEGRVLVTADDAIIITSGNTIDVGEGMDPPKAIFLNAENGNISLSYRVLNNGNAYTSFAGNCVSSGSVFVTRYGDLCIVEGNLTPTAALTSAVTILDAAKIPPRAYGGTKWINVSNANRPNVTAKINALAVAINQTGGLQLNYGGPYRYDFRYIYIADWDGF